VGSFVSRLSLLLVCLLVLGITPLAVADTECVSYELTAPVIGTRSGTRCIVLPHPFDVPFSVQNCKTVPPLGVMVCVSLDLHLPLPQEANDVSQQYARIGEPLGT
jgi:hypothetical protein